MASDDAHENDALETEIQQWLNSLEYVIQHEGRQRASLLLSILNEQANLKGVEICMLGDTPYVNTIPPTQEPPYPGDLDLEERIIKTVQWNASAMVLRANLASPGIGGHISTYSSAATLLEVGFNHFWRAPTDDHPGDLVFFQGHSAPGIYARAFMEGRLSRQRVDNFRREIKRGEGLSSYPHPYLMPDFWQMPTVSMGLTAIMSIYQARFHKYLVDRSITPATDAKIWAMLGDGEMDEPESVGAINFAGNQRLENLIFVVNCNLQRLDGPVRGNSSVVRELERHFLGAGWRVIKVLWSSDWDRLLADPKAGRTLIRRMGEVCDGEYQKYSVAGGAYMRENFFGKYPELLDLVADIPDEKLPLLRRGGHDCRKVYAAYKAAVETEGRPTVILVQSVKGFGQGAAGEGLNVAHKQTHMTDEELQAFKRRLNLQLTDEQAAEAELVELKPETPEYKYMMRLRDQLGGPYPVRTETAPALETPDPADYATYLGRTGDNDVSTTKAFVRMLSRLLKDENLGRYLVPIVPDEARTFGMESLFRQCGIYSHVGQRYEPVDSDKMLYYREATDGQILEEGITEAGCMASFIAAGSSYSTRGAPMIPMFIFYSMFGFQRVGDMIWAAGDTGCKGFIVGATSGRTTLNGEGLQHQDGHSHLIAATNPAIRAYDPAFDYETAVILLDGLRKMYADGEKVMYYITVVNESHPMDPMPEGAIDGIVKGMYKLSYRMAGDGGPQVQLISSGAILFEAIKAQEILSQRYGVASTLWSATSWTELAREARACERWNRLHPDQEARKPYVAGLLSEAEGPFVAVSDYMRDVPEQLRPWIPGEYQVLGTDGFGRSDSREALREFFEVNAEHIAYAALHQLALRYEFDPARLPGILSELGIDPDLPAPWTV